MSQENQEWVTVFYLTFCFWPTVLKVIPCQTNMEVYWKDHRTVPSSWMTQKKPSEFSCTFWPGKRFQCFFILSSCLPVFILLTGKQVWRIYITQSSFQGLLQHDKKPDVSRVLPAIFSFLSIQTNMRKYTDTNHVLAAGLQKMGSPASTVRNYPLRLQSIQRPWQIMILRSVSEVLVS